MFFEFFLHKKLKKCRSIWVTVAPSGSAPRRWGAHPPLLLPGSMTPPLRSSPCRISPLLLLGSAAATATGECATAAAEELSRCWWPVAAPLRSSERLREREKRWIWI